MKKAEFRHARNGLGHLLSCMGVTCPHLMPPSLGDKFPEFMDDWKELYASIDLSIAAVEYLDSGDWQEAILRNHMDVCGACLDERQLARSRFGSQEEQALRERVNAQRADRMARTMTLLQRWGVKIDDQEDRAKARRRWKDSQRKRTGSGSPQNDTQESQSLSDFLTGIVHRLTAQYGDFIDPQAIFEVLEQDRRLWDGLSASSDERHQIGSRLKGSERLELEILVLRKFSQLSVLEKVIDEAKFLARVTPFIIALERYLKTEKHSKNASDSFAQFQSKILDTELLARSMLSRPRSRHEKCFFDLLNDILSNEPNGSLGTALTLQDSPLRERLEDWLKAEGNKSGSETEEWNSLGHWTLLENDKAAEQAKPQAGIVPMEGTLIRPLRAWLWGQRRTKLAGPISGDPAFGQPEEVLLWLILDRVYLGRESLAATRRALQLKSGSVKNALEKFEKEIPQILEFVFKFGPRAKDLSTLLEWRSRFEAKGGSTIQLRRILKPLRESQRSTSEIIASLESPK
ncbi:MAG: hypothetical protein P1V97_10260 [Planctomycetota bacterium]|nr:hypothetical protein [Planctomycetota bacterium]